MKKFVSIALVVCFILMPFSIANEGIREEISFEKPTLIYNGYAMISSKMPYLHIPGYPMLPYMVKTYIFPFGTKIESINVNARNIKEIEIKEKIQPSPAPSLYGNERMEKGEIYEKDAFYPEKWYDYKIRAGIKNGRHVIFLNLYIYPYRYNALRNLIKYAEFDISIEYNIHPIILPSDYDLLIIAPADFENALQPLIQHKENHGIKTIFMSVEDIYSSYDGRDGAEKVKYAIKDAIEQHGIKYVMLVGGLSSLMAGKNWLVPVRYSHLNDGAEGSYISDLYFSDIYKYEDGKIVFEDWDSNGNGIFAEWSGFQKDEIDLMPDIYLGRLACRNEKEVEAVVNKIIEYENNGGQAWFKKLILAGGDTFYDPGTNYYEGEIANEKVAEILDDFTPIKIWYSEGNLKESNIINAINNGGGFLYLSGHGSPGMWLAKDFSDPNNPKYILGLDVYRMYGLKNKGMYPVVVIGGCHNSMFNATFLGSLKEIIQSIIVKYIMGRHFTTWYWMPIPECFGWTFVRTADKGAIATIGCTGLGYGATGDRNRDGIPDNLQYYTGRVEIHFFEIYHEGMKKIGEIHTQDLIDYINEAEPMRDQIACKTVQEWVLLGDPTLMIGGY